MKNSSLSLTLGVLFVLLSGHSANAADTWNSGTGTSWNTAGDWLSGSVPTTGDAVILDKSNVSIPSATGLDAGFSLSNLQFGSSTGPALGAFTLEADTTTTSPAARTLTLGATNSIVMDASVQGTVAVGNAANGALTLAASGAGLAIVNNTNTQTLTIAAVIGTTTDGKNLSLNGANGSTIILSGANLSSGALSIGSVTSGTLVQLSNAAAINSFSGVTVSSGSVLDVNGQTLTAGAGGSLTINGAGFGTGVDTGALVNSTGTGTYANAITLGSASTIKSSGTALNLSGLITNGGFLLTVDGVGATNINGGVSGIGGLTKNGTGTLTIGAAAAYSGATTVNAGTLTLTVGGLTGATAITVNTGGTLTQSGTGIIGSAAASVAVNGGTATLSLANTYTGATSVSAGTLTVSGNLSGGTAISVTGGTFNQSLAASIISGGASVAVSGGVATLTGANTFTGGVNLSGGTLTLANATALGGATSTFTISGGTLDSTTASLVLSANNPVALNGSFTFLGTQNLSLGSGAVTLGATPTITVNANTLTETGAIASTANGITKAGAGTLVLNSAAVNAYTGATTVSGGTLIVDYANATTPTNSLINSGSALTLGGGGGGTLQVKQKASAATTLNVASTSITSGADAITATNVATNAILTIGLGAITQTKGGTVNFTLPTATFGSITTTSTNSNATTTAAGGILGTWATTGAGTTQAYASDGAGSVVAYTGATAAATPANLTDNTGTVNYNLAAGSATGLTTSVSANTVRFTPNASGTIDIGTVASNSNTLTLNGLMAVGNTGTLTIQDSGAGATGGLVIGANNELVITGSQAITVSASITGGATGGLTDSDSSTLTLSNTGNSYAGATTLNSGTLSLSGSLTGATAITVNTGATLSETAAGVIGSAAASLTVNGGTATLAGANTYTGATTLNAGTLNINNVSALGSGTFTIAGGTINASTGAIASSTNNPAQAWNGSFTFTGTNNLDLGTGAVTLGVTPTITVTANTLTEDGNISGSGKGITKAGAGTLVLTGTNSTYTGATTVSAGTLNLTGSLNGATAITVNTGATFTESGAGAIGTSAASLTDNSANAVTLVNTNAYTGATTVNTGATVALNGSLTGGTAITLNGTGTLTEAVAGSISGASSLTLNTATTLATGATATLAGANSYSGATTLNAGATLNLNSAGALGTGTFNINGGTINNTSGLAVTTPTNNGAENWNANFTFTGASSYNLGTGAVALGASPTITVTANTLTDGGVISGAYGLNKAGAGTLVLSGNNSYTGLTTLTLGTLTLSGANTTTAGVKIVAGTLNINNAAALGTGTFTVGGTIDNSSTGAIVTTTSNNENWSSFTFTGTNALELDNASTTATIDLTANTTVTTLSPTNALTVDGNISGPFELLKAGVGTLVLTGTNSSGTGTNTALAVTAGTLNITGAYNINSTGATTVSSGAILDISGANGKLTGNQGLTVSGEILLDDRGNGNESLSRLGTSAITLNNNSLLLYQGTDDQSATPYSQTVGAITLASGISTITVNYNDGANGVDARLVAAAATGGLARTASTGGIAFVNGVNLGSAASGSNSVPQLILTTSPTLVGTTAGSASINTGVDNTKIVPYLLGESGTASGAKGTATGTANTFLTYNTSTSTGLRPLNPTDEFMNNSIVSGDNTYITAATNSASTLAINSLVINGGNLSIANGTTLTNTSGALLFVTSNNITSSGGATGTLAFGATEGIISTDASVNSTIGSVITGTVGLTVYGRAGSSLDLTGANTYSGTTGVISGGTLMIGNNSALGTSTLGGNGGTVEADNQARSIGNMLLNGTGGLSSVPLTIGGSNNLTFTGAVNGFAFEDGNNYNTFNYYSNTATTTMAGTYALDNTGAGTHNNSGTFISLGSSANLVMSGTIQDDAAGNASSGDTNGLNVIWAGANSNLTISNGSNNFGQGLAASFSIGTSSSITQTYNTLTLAGGTPLGAGSLGSNTAGVFLVAMTNGETVSNGFVATGGSLNNFTFGLGFAGTNSLTLSGSIGSVVNFVNIGAPTATLTFTGTVSNSITSGGTGNTTFSPTSTQTGASFLHNGDGVLTFSGVNNMTVSDTFNGGTTILDYSATSAGGGSNRLAQNTAAAGSATALTLEGVNLQLSGGSFAQTLGTPTSGTNGTTLLVGQSNISDTNSGTATINLGGLTRAANNGAVMNFQTGVAITSTANGAGAILGGWATVGGTDWAVSNGASAITALSSYDSFATPGTNKNILLNDSFSGAGTTVNSLKITTDTTSQSLTLTSGTLTLSSGGLLFAGANPYTITGGTLASGAGNDLIVYANGAGTLTIASTIGGGTNAFTKAGTGTLVLNNVLNSYSGTTFIDQGVLQIAADAVLGSAGTGGITFQGGTLDVTTAGYTSSRAVVLGADGGTIQVDSGILTLSGVVSGGNGVSAVPFAKTGLGTLVLSGNNTFTGPITVSAGTLQLGVTGTPDNTALGASSTTSQRSDAPVLINGGTLNINGSTVAVGNLTLSSGNITDTAGTPGTLAAYSFNLQSGTVGAALVDDILSGNTGSNSIDLYKTTAGTVILTGANTYSGATQISAGTLQIGNATTTGTLGTANVTMSGGSSLVFDRSNNYTVANAISDLVASGGTAGSVSQIGAGTLFLTGSNSFTGGLTISNGTVSVATVAASGVAQPLGNGLVTLAGASAAQGILQYTGGTSTLTQNVTVTASTFGTISNTGGGTLTLSGTLTKANSTLTLSGGIFDVTGQITGGTGATFNSDFVVNGGATVTLDNASDNYTGPTFVYGGGTLKDGVGTMPSGTVLTLGNSGDGAVTNTFDLNGDNQSIGALDSTSNGGSTNINKVTNSAAGTGTNTLTLTGVNSDSVAVNSTFGGVISNGATAFTALTISGGTHTLSGVNTYTGATTVNAGTLIVSGSTASGSAVAINNGGTLGGASNANEGTLNGTVGVAGGGAINLTDSTIGTLHTGALTIGQAGTPSLLTFEITSGGSNNLDSISVAGSLTMVGSNGTSITIANIGSPTLTPGLYTLIGYSGSEFGTLSNLNLLTTSLDGDTLSLVQGSGVIELQVTSSAAAAYFNGLGNDLNTAANTDTDVSTGTANGSAPTGVTNVFFSANRNTSNSTPSISAPLVVNSVNFGTGSGVNSNITVSSINNTTDNLTIMASNANSNTPGNGITILTGGGNDTISAPVVLGASQTWTTTDSGSTLTVSGQVSGSGFSMTKAGAGTLALTNASGNTYTGGTTVSAGALRISNSSGSATGTGALAVSAGATLEGKGLSSGSSFNVSGTSTSARANVLVGQDTASDINTASNMTMLGSGSSTIANANLTFNLNVNIAGGLGTGANGTGVANSGNELLVGNTPISFGAGSQSVILTLNLQNSGVVPLNTPYVLFAGNVGAGNATSQYLNLSLGTPTGTLAGGLLTPILNSGNGGTGNLSLAMSGLSATYYGANSYLFLYQNTTSGVDDIEVEVVPEPSTWALLLGGMGFLLVYLRRQRQRLGA